MLSEMKLDLVKWNKVELDKDFIIKLGNGYKTLQYIMRSHYHVLSTGSNIMLQMR